jgi:cold shock protein
MEKGTVKKITENGFGFILPDGAEKDIFFHANEVKDGAFNSLKEGQAVEFEIAEGQKGPNAVNVSPVDGADAPAESTDSDDAPAAEAEATDESAM